MIIAFNQEKALVGAFSVITNLRMELFEALLCADCVDLVRGGDHVLVAEAAHHDGDQQTEEGLQLPQPVLVQAQEGEGVDDCYEDPAPQGN